MPTGRKKEKPKKPRNGGLWTESRYRSFIISALRSASTRWGPKNECIKNARVRRGVYKCELCKKEGPATLPPKEGNKRRRKNIVADHIEPIVDVTTGFVDWNTWIDRCFVEADGYQALCHDCHTNIKTKQEKEIAKLYSKLRKDNPREYKTWSNMMSRCYNENSTGYEYYGERGIKVCDRWNDFKLFLEDMAPRPNGTTLDRIDNNGHYNPNNCRWASPQEQARNTSLNTSLTYKGKTMLICEWAEELGIKQNTISTRLKRGWEIGECLGLKEREKKAYNGRLTDDQLLYMADTLPKGEESTLSLGEKFNIDPSAISRTASKLGIVIKNKQTPKREMIERAGEMRNKFYKLKDIAEELGVSQSTASNYVKTYNEEKRIARERRKK